MKQFITYQCAAPGEAVFIHIEGVEQEPVLGRRPVLDMRQDLVNHSPDGAAWGYGGSGPQQLSLALLCHVTNNDDVALRWKAAFCHDMISRHAQDQPFKITKEQIESWLNAHDWMPVPEGAT